MMSSVRCSVQHGAFCLLDHNQNTNDILFADTHASAAVAERQAPKVRTNEQRIKDSHKSCQIWKSCSP